MSQTTYQKIEKPLDREQLLELFLQERLEELGAVFGNAHIEGLLLGWASNSHITVFTGSADPPDNSRRLRVTSPVTVPVSVGANAWGHVYLFNNAGVPAIEVVTASPANYFGVAHQKTGDPSRRYIGSVRTNAGGQVMKFYHQGDTVMYLENTTAAPFRVLPAGVATTETTVSLANVVPPTSNLAIIKYVNTSTTQTAYLGNASERDTTNLIRNVYVGVEVAGEFPLAEFQTMTYKYAGSPGAGALYIDVQGYRFVR